MKKWPYLSKGLFDPKGIKFWLHDVAKIEQSLGPNSIEMILNNIVIKPNQNYSDLVDVPLSYLTYFNKEELQPNIQKILGNELKI